MLQGFLKLVFLKRFILAFKFGLLYNEVIFTDRSNCLLLI